MKIVKSLEHTDKYCIFCKGDLRGDTFCEINVPLLLGRKFKGKMFNHLIHLSCALKFLKQLREPNLADRVLRKILEREYYKRLMILEKL